MIYVFPILSMTYIRIHYLIYKSYSRELIRSILILRHRVENRTGYAVDFDLYYISATKHGINK